MVCVQMCLLLIHHEHLFNSSCGRSTKSLRHAAPEYNVQRAALLAARRPLAVQYALYEVHPLFHHMILTIP